MAPGAKVLPKDKDMPSGIPVIKTKFTAFSTVIKYLYHKQSGIFS